MSQKKKGSVSSHLFRRLRITSLYYSRVGRPLDPWKASRKLGKGNPRAEGRQARDHKAQKGRRAGVVVVDVSRQHKDPGSDRPADAHRY